MDLVDLEPNQNIIYITEEEPRSEWTYDATKELLKIYDEKSDLLDTGIISTQKKLWELTSKAMAKKGYNYTGAQCENKWKTLKRSYRAKLERMQKYGNSKRPCPFEFEVAEILSKRPNDSLCRNYSHKISELKKEGELFRINLNEPPGFSKDVNEVSKSNDVEIKEENIVTQEYEEGSEQAYGIMQDTTNSMLLEELTDLKNVLSKHTRVSTQVLKQTNVVQERILDCLEKIADGQNEARKLEEKKLKQQNEVVQQMKLQNELLQKFLDRLV